MRVRSPWKVIFYAIANYWRPSLLSIASAAAVLALIFFRLATLTPGFSNDEIAARAASSNIGNLQTDPLYAPHKVLQFGLHYLNHHGPLAMRSISALIGFITILGFYYVMRRWYTRRTAFLTTILLATSAWFLHIIRLSTPDSTFLLLFLFFAAGVWLQQSKRKGVAFIAATLSAMSLLYIPGAIWFLIPAVLWQRKRVFEAVEQLPVWQLAFCMLAGVALISPLVLALIQQAGFYKAWLGLPEQLPDALRVAKNLVSTPLQLVWRGPDDATRWLGNLPLLDWFSAIMLAVGVYAHWLKLHLDRSWLFIYVAVAGTILVSLGGPVNLVLIMPFIYIVVGSGVALMLQQWFTVFPRNPVAKGLGLGFMIIAIVGSSLYNLDHYFVAWPNAPETKAAFQNQP